GDLGAWARHERFRLRGIGCSCREKSMSADAGQVKTQIESDAQNQIGVRAARLQSLPRDSLDESQARDSLRADLVDLDRIPRESRGRADAAAVLAANAATQASYGSALRERPPELVAEVDAAARSAEQASRNTIERGPEREAARPAPETIVLDAAVRERLAGLRARDRETVGLPESNSPGNDGQVSERFITALDKRMEKSELEELGWKGRDDLNDVMRDLRKLASVDFQRASDLWSKYRPDDKDKPPFLDDDELSEARRRTTRGAAKENEPAKEFVPPEHLRKRFLQVDDKYYF